MPFYDLDDGAFAPKFLQKVLSLGRQSHAYLFAGRNQELARQSAIAYAQTLFCQEPSITPRDACGHCLACRQVQSLHHPDLHLLQPDGRSIKIEQVRALREALSRSPVTDGGHLVIIDQAQSLGREAANALLKTLEEPPGPTSFLVLSDQASALPQTISSRLQALYFPEGPDAEKGKSPEQQLRKLLQGPSPELEKESQEDLLKQALALRQDLFELLSKLPRLSVDRIAAFTGPLRRQDPWLALAVRLTKSYYSDFLALACGYEGPLHHEETRQAFAQQALPLECIEAILQSCDEAQERILAHVDAEHCLFLMLTKIYRLSQAGH